MDQIKEEILLLLNNLSNARKENNTLREALYLSEMEPLLNKILTKL